MSIIMARHPEFVEGWRRRTRVLIAASVTAVPSNGNALKKVVQYREMEISQISRKRFSQTMLWAVLLSSVVVALAATLGRAMANVKAALTDKPDIAVYLLLKEEDVSSSVLLRSTEDQRDYLVETSDGPKLVKLKKGEKEWFVASEERMHK